MRRDNFTKLLTRKKYLFTDTGKNIIIHGVDPTKRLNSIQSYSEIDLSSINSIPDGVIFDIGIEIVRMEKIPIDKIPSDTYFLNRDVNILIEILGKNTTFKNSEWSNNIDAIKVNGISPIRMLALLLKLNLFQI
jgi:hypothetical protein